jgi:transposase InsO family protein
MEFKAFVESQFEKIIKILQNDNEGEYSSKQFKGFLKEHGYQHQTSTPYMPQQNGIAEHFNITIIKLAYLMIHQRSVNMKYCAEVVNTNMYLKARNSHKIIYGMTPKKTWFNGKKPKVSHLKVFGNICYALKHFEQEQRLNPKIPNACSLGIVRTPKLTD